MGLPFSLVQGVILLTDRYGNITGTRQISGELDTGGAQLTRAAVDGTLRGGRVDAGEFRAADVTLKGGRHALVTDATVTVEQVFGQDNFADSWFFIKQTGALNNTWTISIAAGTSDVTAPDRDVAAYTKVVTVAAPEVGDEIKLRDKIIAALNADALFFPHYKAAAIKDNAAVHIESKYIGEFGDRPTALDFNVVPSGTGVVFFESASNFTMIRRGKKNSGAKDPRDKRLVTIGISGEVQAVPGAVGDLIVLNALSAGSPTMAVNGSVTPVVFTIAADPDKDSFFQELRFYGNGNGIKFGQFLSLNVNLTNGILIEIKSDDILLTLPVIKSTDDMKHKFSFGEGSGFQLHVQAGRDDFMSSFSFSATFPLRKAGTFTTDDYIKVTVRDNLSALQLLEFLGRGFKKEV